MKLWRNVGIMATAMAFSVALLHADEWDKQTIITTNEAIQLPNITLQPGTYVFTLGFTQGRTDSPQGNLVRIWDKDRKHMITSLMTVPNRRITADAGTQLAFWETPAGQPKALRAWFYPGDDWGQEFKYPKNVADKISAYKGQGPVPSMTSQETTTDTASAAPAPAPAADDSKSDTATMPSNSASSDSATTATASNDRAQDNTMAAAPAPAMSNDAPASDDNAKNSPEAMNGNDITATANTANDSTNQTARPDNDTMAQNGKTPARLPQTGSNLPVVGLLGVSMIGLYIGTRLLRSVLS